MPAKKIKQKSLDKENMHIVLRSGKTSEHLVVPCDQLLCAKKDGLKVGTLATFNGGDDPSKRCRGTVIMAGTKQQCKNSMSLIEKTNNKKRPVNSNNKNNSSAESESDTSNNLTIDDKAEERDDDNNSTEESEDESEKVSAYKPISQRPIPDTGASNKSSTLFVTTPASSSLPPTTDSSFNMVLTEIDTNIDVISKRKEVPEETTSGKNKKQRGSKISYLDYEKLKREVSRLQKENNMFKTNWMPRPTGPTIAYFIEIGKILSGQSNGITDEQNKEAKLEEIRRILDMTDADLSSCIHATDITKTCRQLTRFIYRDRKERSTKLVSSIEKDKLQAIHDYARLTHPAQSKTPRSILNNAIGNVFATEKRRQERNDSDDDGVDDSDSDT